MKIKNKNEFKISPGPVLGLGYNRINIEINHLYEYKITIHTFIFFFVKFEYVKFIYN